MNYRYLCLILAYTCLLPVSALYLNGCQPQTPVEQTSNSDSQQVTPQPELSGIAAQIKAIAEPITVRIETSDENGSGIIVARQGETYYVLTAEHVVAKEQEYQIVTSDNKQYPLDYSQVKKIAGSDLAVVQFTSQQGYQVATLANYKSKQEEMLEAMSVAASNPETAEANIEKIGQEYARIFQKTQNLIPWLFRRW
ncbi:MAG: serine protease [Cyanobacteria bacterium P01_A01_bin.83]